MKNFRRSLLAAVIAMPVAGGVQAGPTWGDGFNEVFFSDFENFYRTDANCELIGGCDSTATSPDGYQRLALTANEPIAGDVIVGIFRVQNIDSGGGTVWDFDAGSDEFTGYFAQEIISINDGAGPTGPGDRTDPYSGNTVQYDHLTLGNPATDPFGILDTTQGEMFRLWVDDGAAVTEFSSSGDLFQNIADATDGVFWGSLGTGDAETTPGEFDEDGYAYAHVDLSLTAANTSDAETFLGVDVIEKGAAYNLGLLALVNDINENEIGGLSAAFLCSLAEIASTNVACNDIVGTAEIEANPGFFVTGDSEWIFRSNDPLELYRVVPEPTTLALFGAGLVGLAGLRRRSRRRD